MDKFDLGITYINQIPIGNGYIVAVFMIVFALMLRGMAIDREKAWKTARSSIQPTLKALDPPTTQIRDGIFGAFWGIVFRVLMFGFLIAAVDFAVFSGAITLWAIRLSPLNQILKL